MEELRKDSLTYANIQDREWALKTGDASFLQQFLPARIWDLIAINFLSDTVDPVESSEILDYLKANSEISSIINAEPSSADAFEYFYRRKEIKTPIDRYFVECLAGRHVNKRLQALEDNLLMHISSYFNGVPVKIDNICSGPGYDMIVVVKNNPDIANRISVRNIDTNLSALKRGRALANKAGLNGDFSFVHGDFVKTPRRQAHLIILIGVLCTMSMSTSVKILQILKRFSQIGGTIIYSTNQVIMVQNDPLTDFLMRLASWKMDYKTDEESVLIGELSGWKVKKQFFDNYIHFQCMTVAENK